MFLGRPVRRGEPQWTAEDRGYALAWQRNKAATCSCGTRHDEWDPKQGGDREAYVADIVFCPGHAALALRQKTMPSTKDGTPVPGYLTYLRPARDDDFDDD